jgi:hypothetical protein
LLFSPALVKKPQKREVFNDSGKKYYPGPEKNKNLA